MRICGLTTLMTFCNYIFRNPLPQSVIKYKILSNKLLLQSLFFYLVYIVDDATFHMKNIFKSVMEHVSTCLFAPDTPGAIHHYIFGFFSLHHLDGHWQLLPKSIAWYFQRIFE